MIRKRSVAGPTVNKCRLNLGSLALRLAQCLFDKKRCVGLGKEVVFCKDLEASLTRNSIVGFVLLLFLATVSKRTFVAPRILTPFWQN